jgi:uncharacterized RDD family membrane protein YckC
MKCPKCDYLGFETGSRCRNCGYDFSLMEAETREPEDLPLTPRSGPPRPSEDLWIDPPPEGKGKHAVVAAAREDFELALPLLPGRGTRADEEPLVKMPAEPRAPLAVRRRPNPPKPRITPRTHRRMEEKLALEFAAEDPTPGPGAASGWKASASVADAAHRLAGEATASLARRAMAGLTDHLILLGVDLAIVYTTLRIAGLYLEDWRALPAVPLFTFLGLLKLSYFSAFTAMGGQTIGKMATGIRVVADDPLRLDPGRAIGRTLTGVLSVLPLGLGLLPALFGPEHRALHDRVARTRVVDLPSA